uniref:Regulating synaptic membrane exocytosis 4 n=1 Tax=Astyanax mexicanus TaxID=7994 RepID=A0A8B9L9F4_ASTMX
MERSQSRISLSASFEALAIYFPCMNSFDEDDAGECVCMGVGEIMRNEKMKNKKRRKKKHEQISEMTEYFILKNDFNFLNYSGMCLASDAQFSDFLDGMGPAQFVGRQTLAMTSMGDVEIGLLERNGQLEVDIIQIIVWGNYGRMDRKCFMGVARILLEELDLTSMVIGWYKLFPTSSMVDPTMAPLIRHSSQLSLESTVGPCCERS